MHFLMSQEGDVLKKPGKIWREGVWTRYDHGMVLMYTAFKRQIKWIILIVFYYMFEKFLIHMNISICQNSKICWLKVTWGHAKSPLFMPTNTVLSLLAFILINLSNICFRKFQDSLHWKCLGDFQAFWNAWQAFYSFCIR